MSATASRRLFVASWPADEWRTKYADRLPKLEWAAGGSRVPPANYHLTLAFLGDVSPGGVELVREALGRVRARPFDLTLDYIDYWPKPQVLCLVASEVPETASSLVQALWHGLGRLGFKQDMRPFKAHLTLARHVERRPRTAAIDPIPWPVDRVALVESQTLAEGPIYTPLAFWPLTSSST